MAQGLSRASFLLFFSLSICVGRCGPSTCKENASKRECKENSRHTGRQRSRLSSGWVSARELNLYLHTRKLSLSLFTPSHTHSLSLHSLFFSRLTSFTSHVCYTGSNELLLQNDASAVSNPWPASIASVFQVLTVFLQTPTRTRTCAYAFPARPLARTRARALSLSPPSIAR